MIKEFTFFLIDDDEDDRDLFLLALERTTINFNYLSASSGIEALERLQQDDIKPDFIFLDLNMPQMNGRECLIELKKNPVTSDIPVTIFSTSSDPNDIRETAEMGAAGFITKPSKTSELTAALTNFVAQQLQKK